MSSARLWSTISSDDVKTSVFGALAQILARTRSSPLTLRLAVTNQTALDTCRALVLHLHHTEHLFIEMQGLLLPSLRGPLQLAMETPAPLLRSFTLWDAPDTFQTSHGIHWFGSDAPLLSRVKLRRCQLMVLRNNHALRRTERMLLDPAMDNALPVALDLFPNLKALSVLVPLPYITHPAVMRRLSALRELTMIIEGHKTTIQHILRGLSQLTTRHITIDWRHISQVEGAVPETIAAMSANLPHVDSLTLRYTKTLDISFIESGGMRRSFTGVAFEHRPAPDVFTQITTLTLDELAWRLGEPLPPAPNLTDLCVCLMQPSSYRHDSEETLLGHAEASIFLGSSRRRALVCPALRRVKFALRACNAHDALNEQLLVAPQLVRAFLRSHLVYDAPVLYRLTFVGVVLLLNPADDVAQLFAMARDVELDPRVPRDLRPARDILSWDWP